MSKYHIDLIRGSDSGWQTGRMSAAVRVTDLVSGDWQECSEHRSQHLNMHAAIKVLESREKIVSECKCTTSQTVLGDGCSKCNPEYLIEMLTDEVAELTAGAILEADSTEKDKHIANLERYNLGLANESCEKQRKIAELLNACEEMKADMLRRAKVDSEGFKVVHASSGVWEQFKAAIKAASKVRLFFWHRIIYWRVPCHNKPEVRSANFGHPFMLCDYCNSKGEG